MNKKIAEKRRILERELTKKELISSINNVILEMENSYDNYDLATGELIDYYAYDIKEKLKTFYIDDWVPHCTIAINISNNELNKGYRILKETLKFPIKLNINRVDIL